MRRYAMNELTNERINDLTNMAKIKTIRPIELISGKLKKTDAVGFALRSNTTRRRH